MQEFENIIRELIAFFDQNQALEEAKLKAAEENRPAAVEDYMTKEQAIILKLRGLDKKREEIQKQMGWEGKSFRQILELLSEEERVKFSQLFEDLSQRVKVFQSTNESALEIISLNLRQIRAAIKEKDTKGIYNQDGDSVEAQPRHLTNRRV